MIRIDPAKLRIIKYPDPRLRKLCQPVEAFDDWLARVADRMLSLMHGAAGIGLAAPQVGLALRMFICNVTGNRADDQVFVNPELSDFGELVEGDEGCLSIPDVTVAVRRYSECTMHAQDVTGKSIEAKSSAILARCWQHEYDHLDGRLIVDVMSEADKIANRRILKQLESAYRAHHPARAR